MKFFRLFGWQALDPSTRHATNLIDLCDDKGELLEADPFFVAHDASENAWLFELEIEPLQRRPFACGWQVDNRRDKTRPTAVTHPAWATAVLLLLVLVLSRTLAHSAEERKALDPAQPHTNGLGMRFVPVVGTKALFSVYQARVRDFRVFVEESGYIHMRETADSESRMWSLDRDGSKQRGHSWENPGFKQMEDDPVVGVSWYDAKAFCEWLTARERFAGRLPAGWAYRLPTDHEWSVAVGLVEEDEQKTPAEKAGVIKDRYPWGKEWPPPAGAGNYAGEEANDGHWPAIFPTLKGYKDGYARTAPAGSFKPNRHGLYDLGSNVLEWCEDLYRPGYINRVLRGASWSSVVRGNLLSSNRYNGQPALRDDVHGFRCVVGSSSP